MIFEIMRPTPKAGRYLQNRPSWQAISNTRKDGTGPLRGGTAPGSDHSSPASFQSFFVEWLGILPWLKRGWGRNRTGDRWIFSPQRLLFNLVRLPWRQG